MDDHGMSPKLQGYFPVFYAKSQMEKELFQLLVEWKIQKNESEEWKLLFVNPFKIYAGTGITGAYCS